MFIAQIKLLMEHKIYSPVEPDIDTTLNFFTNW